MFWRMRWVTTDCSLQIRYMNIKNVYFIKKYKEYPTAQNLTAKNII